jgi:hypothetical protein
MSQITPEEEQGRAPSARRALLRPQTEESRPPAHGPAPAPPTIGGASIVLILLALIVLGSIVGSCYLAYRMVTSFADLPGRVVGGMREALEAGDPTYNTLPAVIEQLRPLSRLQTEEYFLSTVVTATKPRFIGGIAEEKVIFVACGRVTAGVDLSRIQEGDIRTQGTTVTIRLPEAEVFETALDDESGCTYVYEHSHPLLTEPSQELQTEARREAVENFRATALENGILDRAEVRAQEEIARLLLLTGYETIEFAETGEEFILPQE